MRRGARGIKFFARQCFPALAPFSIVVGNKNYSGRILSEASPTLRSAAAVRLANFAIPEKSIRAGLTCIMAGGSRQQQRGKIPL